MQQVPLVSISCITYNHQKYIREAIESFLMQKTTFAFEILINDDASSDGTADIVRNYEKDYPNLIFSICQSENQYSKGVMISPTFNWPRARGKYIALCEGDDYWTDPYKLQKQVDFLEANEEYSACFHDVDILVKDKYERKMFYTQQDILTFEDALHFFMPTCSVVFRNSILSIENLKIFNNKKIIGGDKLLQLLCFHKGRIHYLDNVMAVYRKHLGGVSFNRQLESHYLDSICLFHHVNKFFKRQYKGTLNKKLLINYGEQSVLYWNQKQYLKSVYYLLYSITYIRRFNQMKIIINDYIFKRSNYKI